jgi:hypothetical protein
MALSWKYSSLKAIVKGVLSSDTRWAALRDSSGLFTDICDSLVVSPISSALSHLYHFYQLYSARKYVEQFSNGITIIFLYLNQMPDSKAAPIESSILQVMKEASLLYCLPDNPFFLDSVHSGHAVQEATYACMSSIF